MERPVNPATTHPVTSPLARPGETRLHGYVRIIRKRKWVVIGMLISAVLGTALYVSMLPPIYESTVSLLIEPAGPNVMSKAVEEVYAPMNVNVDYYKTQYEILKSHQILKETATRLNLRAHPEYQSKVRGPLESWFSESQQMLLIVLKEIVGSPPQEAVSTQLSEQEAERRLVKAFKEHIKVSPVLNSRIVKVTAESTDPKLAADAANTMASVYITRALEMKLRAAEEASTWIRGRVEELRQKVEESESTLQAFKARYGLVNVDERKSLVTQKLGDLNNQLVQAETKRTEAEARFRQLASVMNDRDQLESSAEVLNSSLIQNLRGQEVQAAKKVAELSEKYGPKHPAMSRVDSELKEIQVRINSEIKKIYASLKGEYDIAVARERVIRNALNHQKAEAMLMGEHGVQLGILEREVQSNRQLYDMFLKRLKETDLTLDIRTSNIYVADPAIVSMVPVRPKRFQSALFAALLGLLGGLGLSFFLEHMDSSIKSPEDVEQYLPGLAFLGFMPTFVASRRNTGGVDLATHDTPQSPFAENVRSIRTNVMLSTAEKPPKSILITSASENEGKSVLAVNLAIAMAQLGLPTVLIDADLRKPRMHQVFGLRYSKGLSHFLAGEADLKKIIHPTSVPLVQIIPCGVIPRNPAELLQSAQMIHLLEHLENDGLQVIIDSPPVLAVADPVILSHRVDGTILVAWGAHTSRQALRIVVRALTKEENTRLLGIVLQRLTPREMSAYYGAYYPYYRKKYGQKPDKRLARHT